jgi:serine/threonine protein kinase
MGTPHYMAPEAALGKKIDHRVDLYSLGATIYHLLTGKTPYTGTSATEVLKAQVMDPMPAIQDINPAVPDGVCALVERLMAKKPDDRYQSATEVMEELKRLQAGLDLGKDRIAGSETMILQRLAKGEPGAGIATPSESSGGRSTGVEPTGMQNVESRRLRQVFVLGIAAVILFLIILVLPRFLPKTETSTTDNDPDTTSQQTTTTTTDTPRTPDPSLLLTRRLDAIDTALRNNVDADYSALQTEIESILTAKLTTAQRTRAERQQTRIANGILSRDHSQRAQAWNTLTTEVRRLTSEKNFNLALKRIDAFPYKDHADFVINYATLRNDTIKDRDKLLTELNDKLTSYATRKDAQRLREMRDSLPQSLLGSDIEKKIAAELAKLDREASQQHQIILSEIASELLRFDTAKVEEHHRLNRPNFGDGPAGTTADQLLAGARALPPMITALNTAIRGGESHKFRFIGELQRMTNPDLLGANSAGVVVQAPVGSGEIEIAWKTIDLATLTAIVTQVLGEPGPHQAALDALTKATTLAGQ